MRMVDILSRDADDNGDIDAGNLRVSRSAARSSSFPFQSTTAASSPQSLFQRWLLPLRKLSSGGKGSRFSCLRQRKEKPEEDGTSVCPVSNREESSRRTSCEVADEDKSIGPSLVSGKSEDASFSLGTGAGLMLHLAWCESEFSKITEIQSQMETLLKEIKHIVERNEASGFRQSSNSNGSSASDCSVVLNTSKDLSLENCVTLDQDGSMLNMVTNGMPIDNKIFKNTTCPKMDQLAAELEIELEQLYLNIGEENSAVHQGLRGIETPENSNPSECFNLSFNDKKDCDEGLNFDFYDIPPRELERRLHELLQERQQERIAELESELELIQQKLEEKESEASFWREIAIHAAKAD